MYYLNNHAGNMTDEREHFKSSINSFYTEEALTSWL